MVPPVTSQYLNLAKNSSLAIAIGYPDLFSISGTVFNQTGAAIEIIVIMMLSYLSMSLVHFAVDEYLQPANSIGGALI